MKIQKGRKVIIAVFEDGYCSAFTTLTNCCTYFWLPYHSLKNKDFPIEVVVPEGRKTWAGEKLTIRKVILWGSEVKYFERKKK